MLGVEVAISLGGPLVAPRQESPVDFLYLALNGSALSGAPRIRKPPTLPLRALTPLPNSEDWSRLKRKRERGDVRRHVLHVRTRVTLPFLSQKTFSAS